MKKVLLIYGTIIFNHSDKKAEVQEFGGQLWVNEEGAVEFGASLIENDVCDSFIIPALMKNWDIVLNITETEK